MVKHENFKMFQVEDYGSTFLSGTIEGDESETYTVSMGGTSFENVSAGQIITFTGLEPNNSYDVEVTRLKRYVSLIIVRKGTDPLNIAEVQVFDLDGNNVALEATATQSSTLGDAEASRAIDGNTSGYWADKSIMHTARQTSETAQHWWRLVLKEPTKLSSIVIHNRIDSQGTMDRLDGALIRLDDDTGGWKWEALTTDAVQNVNV